MQRNKSIPCWRFPDENDKYKEDEDQDCDGCKEEPGQDDVGGAAQAGACNG